MEHQPEGNAIVYCEGAYQTTNGKTAHGLVRMTHRYNVVAVVDSTCAGQDAGTILDDRERGIPIVASVEDAVKSTPGSRFDGFNLSDIFEYMDDRLTGQNIRLLLQHSSPKARLVYWNMLVSRGYSPEFKDQLTPLTEIAESLFKEDKAFFYKRLIIEEVK